MGHQTARSYIDLQKRLEDAAQGAPASNALFKILEILFTEKEAKYASLLPLKFFPISKAAKIWKLSENDAFKILDNLADKGILIDIDRDGQQFYVLAPTMAGFFEFSLMRTDGKFDNKILSELYHQYINEEDDFIARNFSWPTQIERVIAHEDTLPTENSEILDYEKASHIINSATCIGLGTCYCRHKKEHLGKACNMPQEVCLTFNGCAESLVKHGIAAEISKEKAMEVLDRCVKLGLVQIGDNVQEGMNWICNCCSCCCEAIYAYKQLGYATNMTSNFICENDYTTCTGCGVCVKKCPVDAITIQEINKKRVAVIDEKRCIGCGVCTRFCPTKSLKMKRTPHPVTVPKDSFERMVRLAIESGTLQNYIFDNYGSLTHKILRNILGTILNFPPAKKLLASKQLKSTYLNKLIEKQKNKIKNKS